MTRPPVLLIHSGGFTSRQWRKLADILAVDHEVLAPDLLGYGAAGPWPEGEPFHFHQDIAHLEPFLDRLSAGGRRVHLIGHSYGGLMALQLALRHAGAVASIAVYEPVAVGILQGVEDADARAQLDLARRSYDRTVPGGDDAWLAGFVEWWNGPGAWAALAPETQGAFRTVGWKLSQEVSSLLDDTTDAAGYGAIAAPTLLLGGAQSPMAERRVLQRLAENLPRATLEVFDGMGHMGPVTHASVVNAAIVGHLRAHGAAS
jgi:pimeloyl-ACP methyl ester carboxylesterase